VFYSIVDIPAKDTKNITSFPLKLVVMDEKQQLMELAI
tara:strand:+ start:376 stop:489 length:114 start_codon:yes stop_codon:yes gene_type:complete